MLRIDPSPDLTHINLSPYVLDHTRESETEGCGDLQRLEPLFLEYYQKELVEQVLRVSEESEESEG